MKSGIFNSNFEWDSFNYRDGEQRKMLRAALQYFLALPDRFISRSLPQAAQQQFMKQREEIRSAQAKLQEFATTADFPASILPIIEKYHILPTYDNGFEQIFDIRDYSDSARDGFSVSTVQSGLSFRRVKVGEKAKVYEMSGEKSYCYFDYYAGALGWHRQLFEDKDYWAIEDNAIQFRNKAYSARAQVFYALIEAVAEHKSACIATEDPGCEDCDWLALADANALNQAAMTISLACQNKGYGDLLNSTFIILAPIQLRGRLRRALSVTQQAYAGSERQIDFKFQHITSLMLSSATRYWVILPKFLAKGGYRMDLTLLSDFDILSYTDTTAGWMRFGGCIGDIDQFECVDSTVPSR